ncbi:hypothetical protein TUE45_06508 [Streptomyces reticuli]|uniref:Uncharacterized protein n=1 Tax=Streptomyces bangladeshensis TaxID=295352 RepID=A0ABN3BCD2_9ACTN|nr:hypothetical protein TUE45_06508 [Streptomyces reticuli]
MAAWRNEAEGGSGRTDDSRGPRPARSWQPTSPGENRFTGLAPDTSPRQGESVRLYRRARVTAS